MSVLLWLPAHTWLSFIFSTVYLTEGQFQKIADLFFSASKIRLYHTISILPLLIAVLLFWKRKSFMECLHSYVVSLKVYVVHLGKVQFEILKAQKWNLLMAVLAIPVLYYFFLEKYPFTVDEAFSWLHFVNKGPLVSAFYYPAPNNHILYSIVCSFVNYFPLDPIWVMRIPTMAAYLLSMYVLYVMMLRIQDRRAAYFTVFLFAVHPSIFYFALHGRGYMFLVLFVILSCWFLYSALVNKVKVAYSGLVLSCVLGFYTIPVFLYYFLLLILTSGVYVLWYKAWDRIAILVKSFLAVLLFSVLLYLPVLMLNGVDAVLDNSWVQPWSFNSHELLSYLIRDISFNVTALSGYGFLFSLILIPAFLILFYYERKSSRWLVLAMLLWFPALIAVLKIQSVLPFERIWVPFSVLWILVIVWLDAWLCEIGKNDLAGRVLIFIMIYVSVSELKENFAKGDPYYEQLHAFVDKVDPDDISSVYSGDDTYLVMLQVKFTLAHKEAAFTAVNDLHGQAADLRIIPRDAADKELISVDQESFYSNTSIVAYRRKGLQILR